MSKAMSTTSQAGKNLMDLYVFVNGASREHAEEMVSCYDNEAEIEKTIAIYKAPFHARRHVIDERIPFIPA